MTTEASGNTTSDASSKIMARDYQFTIHELDKYDSLIEILNNLKSCTYYIACKEIAPTTQKEHIHLFAHFSTPYRMSKKIMNLHIHIEKCRGSVKQNIDYIEKDGNIIVEHGCRPSQGIRTVKELREASIDETPAHLYRIKQEIDNKAREETSFFEMLDEIQNDALKKPTIHYYTGASGTGKTYTAYKEALKKYDKTEIGRLTLNNNFIDIINENAKCFVIDEFRPSDIKASHMLQLLDKYGYKANVKGKFVWLRFDELFICSIFEPDTIYRDEEKNEQFIRRIDEIRTFNKETDC